MPPPQHIVTAKLVASIVGATIGGIILIGILPFLLFGCFDFFRRVWRAMFKDRARYLRKEKIRAAWNAEAWREATLRYNAMALVAQWAQQTGVVARGVPQDLAVLVSGIRCPDGVGPRWLPTLTLSDLKVHKNYFPARQYRRHVILVILFDMPRNIRFKFFNSGPRAKLEITRSEWEEAKVRAGGGAYDIKLQSFEQIFWKDEPPSYDTLADNSRQV
jgi:hypothetical protein